MAEKCQARLGCVSQEETKVQAYEQTQTHTAGFSHPAPCAGEMGGRLRCDKDDAFTRHSAGGYDGVSPRAGGRTGAKGRLSLCVS